MKWLGKINLPSLTAVILVVFAFFFVEDDDHRDHVFLMGLIFWAGSRIPPK